MNKITNIFKKIWTHNNMLIFFYSWMNNVHINSASNEQNHKDFWKNLTISYNWTNIQQIQLQMNKITNIFKKISRKIPETKLKSRTRPPCYPQKTRFQPHFEAFFREIRPFFSCFDGFRTENLFVKLRTIRQKFNKNSTKMLIFYS